MMTMMPSLHRTPLLIILLAILLSLAFVCVTAQPIPVELDSHADVAHSPLLSSAAAAFKPHSEMQAPGTIIHHEVQHDTPMTSTTKKSAAINDLTQVFRGPAKEYPLPPHSAGYHVLPHHDGILVGKAPEHSILHLTCASDEGFLHIIDTSFGQGQGTYDFVTGVIHKGDCHAPLDIEKTGCQNKKECVIAANTNNLLNGGQDPCTGTFKRLVVTYKCSHDFIPSDVAPVAAEHSAPIHFHDFLPARLAPEGTPQDPRGFFTHFFHAQKQTTFPFPSGSECEADSHRLCGGLLKQCVGDFACTTQCVTDHFPHLSAACLEKHPCFDDIGKFCSRVEGGENQIMHCLKAHSSQLSGKCTALHPCLIDASCHSIDYDNPDLNVHQPIFKEIPKYMAHLQEAREKGGITKGDDLPFLHLVLPNIVRNAAHHLEELFEETIEGEEHQGHSSKSKNSKKRVTDDADEDEDDASEDDSKETDPTDEDTVNEADPAFDLSQLGTGHFSHIQFRDHPYAVDVLSKNAPTSDGYDVALWSMKSAPAYQQLFDFNHLGQILWMHAGEKQHFCLTAHLTVTHQVVSEKCVEPKLEETSTGAKTPRLPPHGYNQVWLYREGMLHHTATSTCLSVQGTPGNGADLHLVPCSSNDPSQTFAWETGDRVVANPSIFDQHYQHVRELRAKGQYPQLTTDSVPIPSSIPVTSPHDYSHLSHEVANLERTSHQQQHEIDLERSELTSERRQIEQQQRQISDEERRLANIQKDLALKKLKKQRKQAKLREQQSQLESHSQVHSSSSNSSPPHFFTPLTLILSVLFVALLAYVFRVHLFPYFVKRWSRTTPNHYYSHAY